MISIFRNDLFKDRIALVTGGGSGIGLRIAKELVSLGAKVWITGRDEAKLERAAETLIAGGAAEARVRLCTMNIRDHDSVDNGIDTIVREDQKIDLLINNAGGQFPAPAEKISPKGWKAVIETNLTGTFHVAQSVFAVSMKENGGAIVNVIMEMWQGFPLMAHSGAARAGVDNLTKSLAAEWGPFGVRVNAVAPGVIESSGLDTYDPEFRQKVFAMRMFNTTSRLGTEAEVAAGTIFLLSDGASFITGETLRIDGGGSLYRPFHPPVEHDKLPPFDS